MNSNINCFACHQSFESKNLLFSHLQANPSHKRNITSRKAQSRSKPRPRIYSDRGVSAPAKREDIQTRPIKSDQDACTSSLRLQVTTEQDFHLREVLMGMCHSAETLQSCHYRLKNRTRAELEQRQRYLNCDSKRLQGYTKGVKSKRGFW